MISLKTKQTYASLLVLSSLIGTSMFYIDIGFRLSLYRMLLLLSPVFLLSIKKSEGNRRKENANYRYLVFLIIWTFYAVITVLWVHDLSSWANNLLFLVSATISSWIIFDAFRKRNDFIRLFSLLELGFLFISLFSIYDMFTGSFHFNPKYAEEYRANTEWGFTRLGLYYPLGICHNINTTSSYMFMGIMNSLLVSQYKKTLSGKRFSIMLGIVFAFILYVGDSRGAELSLIISLSVLAYFKYKRLSSIKKGNVIVLGIAALIVLIFSSPSIFSAIVDLLPKVNSSESSSDSIRINLIRNGLVFLKDHFFMGVGWGNIEYHQTHFAVYDTQGQINIHNWWLEILVSSGILIFSYYVWVYFRNIKNLFRAIRENRDCSSLPVLLAFMLGFFVVCMVDSGIVDNEFIWLLISSQFLFSGLILKKEKQ